MKFEGIQNLRDLGGHRGAGGKLVKPGLLFRSADLFSASPSDAQRVASELKVAEIIDLRTNMEKEEKPDVEIGGVGNQHVPIFAESAIGITHETGANYSAYIRRTRDRKAILDIVPDMTAIYGRVVLDDDIVAMMGKAIRQVIDNVLNDRPTLFHCSEGKDRAGAIAAFILCLLGVPEEDVVRDYAATNKSVRAKALLNAVLVAVFKLHPKAAVKVWRASIADPAYLKHSFDVIRKNYGSLETFMRDGLGISDELRDQFRSRALSI